MALADNLNAAANLFLGRELINSAGLLDEAQMEAETRKIMARLNPNFRKFNVPVSALSGGQRQRIALARTMLSRPKMLVLDEATSALDYDTERRVCNNLLESLRDCTVFFITHRLTTIRNADLVVMMHQGAIVEMGTHGELMDRRGRY